MLAWGSPMTSRGPFTRRCAGAAEGDVRGTSAADHRQLFLCGGEL